MPGPLRLVAAVCVLAAISAGVWDPATNTNVPNTIAGEAVADHLSIYYKTSYRFDGYHCDDVLAGAC